MDEDFSAQLQALVAEAEKKIGSSPGRPEATPGARQEPSFTKADMNWIKDLIEPLAVGVRAIKARQDEGVKVLERIEREFVQAGRTTQLLDEARSVIEQRNAVNKGMFEALHAELKGYKDSFMLDVILKPTIRDLIAIYDGTCEIARQLDAAAGGVNADAQAATLEPLLAVVRTLHSNVDHHAHFILEVLERMDVTLLPLREGKLDKLTQKAVEVAQAEDPEEDQMVISVLKRGFVWRGRVVRAEEVIIKKWKDRSHAPLNPQPAK